MNSDPPEETTAQFWNKRYLDTDALWSREPNAALVQATTGLVPGRALDLGAGEGRNAVWLATRGWQVTALDISDVALSRAAEHAAAEGVSLDCVVADWREHKLSPCSLELVVVCYMHAHPHERVQMFDVAARALAPGGRLFVAGVDLVDHGRRGPPDRERLYTPERLREALRGMELLRCETISYEQQHSSGRRQVRDVVAIARPARSRARPISAGGAR